MRKIHTIAITSHFLMTILTGCSSKDESSEVSNCDPNAEVVDQNCEPSKVESSVPPETDQSNGTDGVDEIVFGEILTITSIAPTGGPATGNTSVLISGTGFVSGISVKFDNAACIDVTVIESTLISCKTPASNPGVVDVIITRDSATVSLENRFTYSSNALLEIIGVESSFSFAEMAVGWGASSNAFTVRNNGGMDATSVTGTALGNDIAYVGSGNYPGYYFDPDQRCGNTIPVGTECKINIGFNPTSTGAKSTTLSITYNNGSTNASLSKTLNGDAVARSAPMGDFGVDGFVEANVESDESDSFVAVHESDEGKLIVAGMALSTYFELFVRRYHADGLIDTSFATNGQWRLSAPEDCANADVEPLAVRSVSQKIIVVSKCNSNQAASRLIVNRLASNGSVDTSFGGGDGMVSIDATGSTEKWNGASITDEGRIVAVGRTGTGTTLDSLVVVLTSLGALDSSFNSDGVFTHSFDSNEDEEIYSAVFDAVGTLFAVGEATMSNRQKGTVIKLTPSGNLDPDFDGSSGTANGAFTYNWSSTSGDIFKVVAIDSNDRIVIAGHSFISSPYTNDTIVLRLNELSGTLDTDFSEDGRLSFNLGADDALSAMVPGMQDQRVYIGTAYTDNGIHWGLVRIDGDGTLSPDFNTTGYRSYPHPTMSQSVPSGMTTNSLGNIIMVGSFGLFSDSFSGIGMFWD